MIVVGWVGESIVGGRVWAAPYRASTTLNKLRCVILFWYEELVKKFESVVSEGKSFWSVDSIEDKVL